MEIIKGLPDEMRRMPMKNLGYANGWSEAPELVKSARAKGLSEYYEATGRCETTYYCPEGGYYYSVDSSD
jgi:hypothetical protein